MKLFEEVVTKLVEAGFVEELAHSMPRRIAACIENEGGPTKY